ncbi:MAG: substrate-binding domain-containing protein, partial [Caldilineaceae bacterium]|nr:substrate-binding domain-containing protein [Caldilineaceae bacterium]
AQGHRRIAVAALGPRPGNAPIPRMERRMAGYRQAMAEFGLDPNSLQEVPTAGLLSAGAESLDAVMALSPRPTALLCTNDVRALGILAAAKTRGLAVPGDLAVIGFDDLPDARLASPPLTTVCQRMAERVRKAVDLLMQIIEAKEGDMVTEEAVSPMIFPAELIVRQSA